MKVKFLIIVLLTFLAVSAVSAGDNVTSNDAQIASQINVTFDEKIYVENLTDIEVSLPENASGNLKARINDVEIYNENVTNTTVKIPITLPEPKFPYLISNVKDTINISNADTTNKLLFMDYTLYSVNVTYNGIDVKIDHPLMVMTYPKNHTFIMPISSEILKDSPYSRFYLMFPQSARGSIDVLIDNKFHKRYNITGSFTPLDFPDSLSLGNHSIMIIYTGDDYYEPSNQTTSFNLTDVKINIPKNILLYHDDCVSVETVKHKDGKVAIYVDGKKIVSKKLDSDGELIYSLFDLSCGTHEIEVKFTSKKLNRTKKAVVNVSYEIYDPYPTSFVYGEENILDFYSVPDLDIKRVRVTINGVNFPVYKDDASIMVNITSLEAGNYTIVFKYLGDKKYNSVTLNSNFTVKYKIMSSDYWFFDYGSDVSLKLPADAKGSLQVYLDGVLYKSKRLVDGHAVIKMKNLAPGEYNITCIYSGSDYEVENFTGSYEVYPVVRAPYEMYVGDDEKITLTSDKNIKAVVNFTVSGKTYSVNLKNGVASFDLSKLNASEYDIEMVYVDEKNFTYYHYVFLDVYKSKIQIKNVKNPVYDSKYKFKVYLNEKLLKNKKITVKIGKYSFKVKTNKKGIASIKLPSKLAPKKYKMTLKYSNVKKTKKITIRHSLKLKVSKKAKKLIVNVKGIKNKKITVKINKKIIKTKTNKKGIAKVTYKIPKTKKVTVRAIYLKDTVKKTVKVKR